MKRHSRNRSGKTPARPAAALRRSARAVLARPRHGEPVLLAEARQTGADGPLQALQFGVGRRQGHNERAPFAGELDDAGRLTPVRETRRPVAAASPWPPAPFLLDCSESSAGCALSAGLA